MVLYNLLSLFSKGFTLSVFETILKELYNYADENVANQTKKFFKTGIGEYSEGDIFLGVKVPVLRKLSKKYKQLSLDETILLLKSEYHESRLLALFILIFHFENASKQKQTIYELYLSHTQYINNWDLVDSSAHKIVGSYLLDKNRDILYRLVQSDSLWERRIAVVATLWFIKHLQLNDTIKLAEMLLKDKEDLIHKAVGWVLREVGKQDKQLLINFLEKHSKVMPRVMLRYSLEKFSKEERKKYM
ncbi:DNA alkylation repair protein [Sulfurimonas sp. C5]|uniref:DNA alkylation repair protein n=1 Tax=Sulfurimonas sp. C5 TaxID=3036947 RepID=UPI002455C090|nr:DNA alkylation repair protein [Sulfurimonas sp. C5]MDH4944433.1 DNA alkylation repair protein [Sulfurimonas sp. C5]